MLHCRRLAKHFAAAAACTLGSPASSEIIHWSDANLVVPANIDGLYINVQSRAVGSFGSSVAGWDINPYSATALSWFNGFGAGMMRYPGATSGSAANLPLGTQVGPAASYGSGTVVVGTQPGNWQLNSPNYFGFRFVGADGQTRYGWGRFDIGAALNGPDRVIVELAYENIPGTPILVGDASCATWFRDSDGDGLGSASDGTLVSCSQPIGYVATDGDNCASVANPDQADLNGNLIGDACEYARGDLNLDGVVSASDIPLLLAEWGSSTPGLADLNRDGAVTAQDLTILLTNWGSTP